MGADEEGRSTLHALPETPYKVRKPESVGTLRVGVSGGAKISVLHPRGKGRSKSEGDNLREGTRVSEFMDTAPKVHLGGGAGMD